MISPELFNRLRAAQLRSVREQELLSGRNWILLCACAHILGLIYPGFLLIHVSLLGSEGLHHGLRLHPLVNIAFITASGLALLACWAWARFAPYRAALLALAAFLLIQAAHAVADPYQLTVAALVKLFVIIGLIHAVIVARSRRHAQ
jgi:hypothetical protein